MTTMREQLRASNDRPVSAPLNVPGWDFEAYVRKGDVSAFACIEEMGARQDRGEVSAFETMVRVCAHLMCEPDGTAAFDPENEEDLALLRSRDPEALKVVFIAGLDICGLSSEVARAEVEGEEEGNSEGVQG